MILRRFSQLAAVLTCFLVALPALAAPAPRYEPTWESLAKHNEAPDWFRDAKFGIYFHWGVYSVPAFGSEWYPRNMHRKEAREYKHHVATYGEPNEFGYHDFVPLFKAEHFDAEEWAALFEQAGARFAGPVAEHHDGFAMWASKLTPWNVKDMGPKRDITGELAAAIRKRGMRFVTTFHHARNQGHYPRVEGWPTTSDDPKLQLLYGNMPRDKFLDLWLGKLKEVIDNYQPDLMWFDSWLNEIPEEIQREYLAYYFNRAREWGREVVVTRKQNDLPLSVSVEDFEKGRADRLTENVWLTDDTISKGSWCYTSNLQIKPFREVLHTFLDIVSKNGCLLLNISPKADGTIPDDQREVLLGLGTWLRSCGEAVYGTRPWVVYGEGPTQMKKGGHFVGTVNYTEKDVRFTTKGDTLYAVFLGQPEGRATIESLATNSGLFGGSVKRTSLVAGGQVLKHVQDEHGLHVTFPPGLLPRDAVALKIEGLTIKGFEPDLSVRFRDGKATLGADRVELHGSRINREKKDDGRTSVGFWDDPADWLSWDVTFAEGGTYRVSARIASLKPSAFTVHVGEQTLCCKVEPTGDWARFQSMSLGSLTVAEPGRVEVRVVPDADAWAAINLSQVELTAR